MTRRRWIVIGLAGTLVVALGCGLLAVVINRVTGPLPAATAIPPRTVAVVVTTHDIPIRSLLQPADVMLMDVPVQLAPLEAVSDLEAAVGRITMIPLVTGETIAAHHLADPTNYAHDLAFVIADDQVLMAFPSNDLMSQMPLHCKYCLPFASHEIASCWANDTDSICIPISSSNNKARGSIISIDPDAANISKGYCCFNTII